MFVFFRKKRNNQDECHQNTEVIYTYKKRGAFSSFYECEDELNYEEECIDPIEEDTKRLCAKLKDHLSVDMAFWNEMNMDFKCNLVPFYDALQLNFEIKNNGGMSHNNVCDGICVKANFYDKKENLIYIDETYIDDDILRKKRFSDYLLVDYNVIYEATSIYVYAYLDE